MKRLVSLKNSEKNKWLTSCCRCQKYTKYVLTKLESKFYRLSVLVNVQSMGFLFLISERKLFWSNTLYGMPCIYRYIQDGHVKCIAVAVSQIYLYFKIKEWSGSHVVNLGFSLRFMDKMLLLLCEV
jgi:hypothetical protein